MSILSITTDEHYKWGDDFDAWYLVKTNNLKVVKKSLPSGGRDGRHYHNTMEQYYFIIEGKASIELEGEHFLLEKNQGLYISRGSIHRISNDTKNELVFTVTSTPPTHHDRKSV